MAEKKRIPLSSPIDWFGTEIKELSLKEPSGWTVATLGEPRVLVHAGAGGGYMVEREDVIAKYIEKCLDHDSGADILRQLSLIDTLKLKAALFDFFTEAEAQIASEKLANFASALNDSPSPKSVN